MINVELQVKLLKKLKVSQPQLLYLICVYENKIKVLEDYGKHFHIPESDCYIGRIAFDQLVRDEYITFNKDKIPFISEKFKRNYIDEFNAFDDLRGNYPDFAVINGIKTPLLAADEDKYRVMYAKKIGKSYDEHVQVLEDLEYAIKNNYNFVALRTFIESSLWNSYRKARNKVEVIGKVDKAMKLF